MHAVTMVLFWPARRVPSKAAGQSRVRPRPATFPSMPPGIESIRMYLSRAFHCSDRFVADRRLADGRFGPRDQTHTPSASATGFEDPCRRSGTLAQKANALAKAIERVRPTNYLNDVWLPDVEVYLNAVQYALDNGEFFDLRDVAKAEQLLARGQARLKELDAAAIRLGTNGEAHWSRVFDRIWTIPSSPTVW